MDSKMYEYCRLLVVLYLHSPDLMVKVMRYYARFIVVGLLLNRKKVVLELVDELTKHVDEYIKSLKPTDAQEWYLVLQEITTFLQVCIHNISYNNSH